MVGDDDTGHRRPVVQVALVREATIVVSVVTPLDALFAPPFQNGATAGVIPKGEQSDVVRPVYLKTPQSRREPVRDDQDRSVGELLEDGFRGGVKQQIGVEIGDGIGIRRLVQHE